MKQYFLTVLIVFFASVSINSHAQTVKATNNINDNDSVTEATEDDVAIYTSQSIEAGGILHIHSPKFETPFYRAKLGQTRTVIISGATHDDIYAGVDINTIPGEYLLTIETQKKQLISYPFIVPAPAEVKFLDLNFANLLLTKAEITKKLLWSNIAPKLPLNFPIKGDWSDNFGHFYEATTANDIENKKAKSLQRIDGINITIDKPTPIVAPSDSVCFLVSFNEENGYTVLLDHGMGLFSEISGLNNLSISEQDRVLKNALIANFNIDDFKGGENKPRKRNVTWRVFINKAIVNPYKLTNL